VVQINETTSPVSVDEIFGTFYLDNSGYDEDEKISEGN
jgi:hypothetical protein